MAWGRPTVIENRRFRILLLVLGAALVVLVAANVVGRLRDDGGVDEVDQTDGAITVTQLLAAPEGRTRTVQGFVFEDAIGLRLCQARQADPVACIGPFVELRGFDPASVPLATVEVDGGSVTYSREPVTLVGMLDITTFVVEDIDA